MVTNFCLLFCHILCILSYIKCFNVDFEYTVLKNGPKNSLFGYSVAEHQDGSNQWMLVGAPRGNNTFVKAESPGTVFSCRATDPKVECNAELKFDSEGINTYESKNNQWFGVSLKSTGKDLPIVSCAHRYEYYGKLSNFRLLEGKCWRLTSDFFGMSEIGVCRSKNGNTPTHESYGQCESGIAIDILPEKNDVTSYLVGAVGSLFFTGRVFDYNTDDASEQYITKTQDSYFGYAIAYGNFLQKNKFTIAMGGPRHNSFGQVLLFTDKSFTTVVQEIPAKEDEIQIASGFGIAICSIDANGDGFSELVIGAPFYSNADNQWPNQGLVYVYSKKDGETKLSLLKKLQGFISRESIKDNSNFGYAVANAGDLNLDGYEDLVIGAPHQEGGSVYIYQGSDTGITDEPSQHIQAANVYSGLNENKIGLSGFGKSFGTGMDLDENGYKDVLVGAYISSQAVLLRSRPVVTPHMTLSFVPKQLNTTDKSCDTRNGKSTCFNMVFCVNFTEASERLYTKPTDEIKVQYSFEADVEAVRSRVRFESGKTTHSLTIPTKRKTDCVTMQKMYLYTEDGIPIPIYPDVTFKVTYSLKYGKDVPKPAKSTSQVVNLDTYPALTESFRGGSMMSGHSLNFQLSFQRECSKCIPDLSITAKKNYSIGLGRKTFRFNVTIKNSGVDPAYTVGLKFKFTDELSVEKIIDGNNNEFVCPNFVCDGIFNQISKDKQVTLGVVLKTDHFKTIKQALAVTSSFSITVTSANDEMNATLADNTLEITLQLKVEADIQLLPGTFTQQVLYSGKVEGESAMKNLNDVGKPVVHRFVVFNKGPDLLPSAQLTIHWPYETMSGKHLLYLVKVSKTSGTTTCVTPQQNFLKIPSGSSGSTASKFTAIVDPNMESQTGRKRRRRDVGGNSTDPVTTKTPEVDNSVVTTSTPGSSVTEKRKKDGKVLNCNTAKCFDIVCDLKDMEVGKTEIITIQSRLWQSSALLDYYGEILSIVSEASVDTGTNITYINDPNLKNNDIELFTNVNPDFAPKEKEQKIWVYVIAALAGVLLLALLIFGLYKLGFFKRKRIDSSKYGVKAAKDDKALIAK